MARDEHIPGVVFPGGAPRREPGVLHPAPPQPTPPPAAAPLANAVPADAVPADELSVDDQIRELARLRDAGILTYEGYAARKAEIFSRM